MPDAKNDPRDDILELIKGQVSGIVTGANYYTTLETATREHKWYYEWEDGDLPAICILGGSERLSYPGGHREVGFFSVILRGTIEEEPPSTIQTRLEHLIEDCKAAVSLDSTLGGVCQDINIVRVDTDEGWAVPRAAFEMEAVVQYARTRSGR